MQVSRVPWIRRRTISGYLHRRSKPRTKAYPVNICLKCRHIKCLNIEEETYAIYNNDSISWVCDNCKETSRVLRNQIVNMQQRIDKQEKRLETPENVAASKEEAAAIAKNEIQSEDTAKIIEENMEKKLQEQPIAGKMTTLQTVQEYMSDLSEVDKRSISFLTHKLPESTAEKKVEQENEDKNQIKEILKHINLNLPEDTAPDLAKISK